MGGGHCLDIVLDRGQVFHLNDKCPVTVCDLNALGRAGQLPKKEQSVRGSSAMAECNKIAETSY